MDRLGQLDAFVAVADAGGFSAAARKLGVSQPAVSKAVALLERRLGAALLSRSTRKVTLTEAGRRLHLRARLLLEELEDAEAETAAGERSLSGLLRISAPATFGRLHVLPLVGELIAASPELRVEILLSDGVGDLVADGVDLAIRVGEVREPDVVVHALGAAPIVCVGSRAYLARRGVPRTPLDLARHDCLVYGFGAGSEEWTFGGPGGPYRVKVSGSLRSDSAEAIRAGVLQGVGLGLVTQSSLAGELDREDIVAVLADYLDVRLPVSAVWPRRRFVPARVRHATRFFETRLQGFQPAPRGSRP